jgi:hypothetical protein
MVGSVGIDEQRPFAGLIAVAGGEGEEGEEGEGAFHFQKLTTFPQKIRVDRKKVG